MRNGVKFLALLLILLWVGDLIGATGYLFYIKQNLFAVINILNGVALGYFAYPHIKDMINNFDISGTN